MSLSKTLHPNCLVLVKPRKPSKMTEKLLTRTLSLKQTNQQNFLNLKVEVSSKAVQPDLSLVMRKPTFCICENKDADQLRGDRKADQRLCFRYIDSTISLLSKYEISMPLAIFCSCTAWFVSDQVENQNVGFLMTRLICQASW